jgi:hypothetical protein
VTISCNILARVLDQTKLVCSYNGNLKKAKPIETKLRSYLRNTLIGCYILDISERENKFILALLNEVEEDPNKPVKRGELYALAKRVGFSEREVYKYAMNFDLRGYLKAEPILGGKIFSVMLTEDGIEFARRLRQKDDR